jgi:starvation-inducible DNA-binding protein
MMSHESAKATRRAPLATPTALHPDGVRDLSGAITLLVADAFALYLKVKGFHWHASGTRFLSHHRVLDEHATQFLAMTDVLAERVRKIGGLTIRSIGHVARLQRILDNDAEYVTPQDILAELREDNRQFLSAMREVHELCDFHRDYATASVLETFIDEAEERVWFLFEMTRARAGENG